MNIAVCLKQVPDTTELRIDPETNTLIREGVDAVLNPLDTFALEAGLRLREVNGGSVTALTMGPPQAGAVLQKAVAMGVDHGVLVSDKAFAGADTWTTSLILARALEHTGPYDLILCGKQAVDGDTAQVGPGIAAHADLPQVTYVTGIRAETDGKSLRIRRLFDQGEADILVELPAVLTVLKEANEPRLPTLAGRIRALKTDFQQVGLAQLGLSAAEVGLEGSPTRVVSIDTPETRRQQIRLPDSPSEGAEQLLEVLRNTGKFE